MPLGTRFDAALSHASILFDYRELGEALFPRFSGGAYGALSDTFRQVMPGRLSERLGRAVAGFAGRRP